jgi:hypothetical protein
VFCSTFIVTFGKRADILKIGHWAIPFSIMRSTSGRVLIDHRVHEARINLEEPQKIAAIRTNGASITFLVYSATQVITWRDQRATWL